MNTHDPDSNEARLRRIETALYLLCRHLGMEPRTGDRLSGSMTQPRRRPVDDDE